MSVNPTLPLPVAALLARALPGAAISDLVPTVGGFSNLTLAARIGGRRCVLKATDDPARRADLQREARILSLLRDRRLGTPALLAQAEDADWFLLIIARRPGRPGITLYSDTPAQLALPYRALGRALARLHRAALAPPPDAAAAGLLLAERATRLAATLIRLPLADDLRTSLDRALAHPIWRPAAPRLVHGDAGLHNIVWGSRGLSLLDWELAGWADPRLDLAWVAWTLRFRGLPPTLWAALLEGYGANSAPARGLDHALSTTLALGQVAALLARSFGRPAAWVEWQRRARWTIASYGG